MNSPIFTIAQAEEEIETAETQGTNLGRWARQVKALGQRRLKTESIWQEESSEPYIDMRVVNGRQPKSRRAVSEKHERAPVSELQLSINRNSHLIS